MDLKPLWKKLFSTYLILGLSNVILCLIFLYNASTAIIKERANNQLFAVSAFAEHELRSYFENLKVQAVQGIEQGSPSLVSVKKISETSRDQYRHMKSFNFYPFEKNFFVLIVPKGDERFVWTYNYEGLNEILSRREGMGETGEVYVVGEDNYIKTASRHVSDWLNIKVENESIRKARVNRRGLEQVKDYRGEEVFSAYAPFEIDDLHFVLLSEIDKEEIFEPLDKTLPRIILLSLLILGLTFIVAVFSTRKVVKVVNRMKRQLNQFNFNIISAVEEESMKLSSEVSESIRDLQEMKGLSEEQGAMVDQVVKKLQNTQSKINTEDEIRRVGFIPAIESFVAKTKTSNGIVTNLWINQRLSEVSFSMAAQINIYRIIQGIFEQFMLAKASQISLVMTKENSNIVLRAECTSLNPITSNSISKILEYRVDSVGGEISQSSDAYSVLVTVRFPIPAAS